MFVTSNVRSSEPSARVAGDVSLLINVFWGCIQLEVGGKELKKSFSPAEEYY